MNEKQEEKQNQTPRTDPHEIQLNDLSDTDHNQV